MMSSLSGEDLVTPADPPEVAIPRLMDLYGGYLYKLGLRLCKSSADAEDMIQETFLLAYRKWDQFEGRADPKTWLYRIASRVSKQMYRKRSGEPKHIQSLDEPLDLGGTVLDEVADDQSSALAEQIHREGRQRMEQAVTALPEQLRMPFILKDVFELTVKDIAYVLGMKEPTVKTRIYRASVQLRHDVTRPPRQDAPPLSYARQACADLTRAKEIARDRGVEFPVSADSMCRRCMAFFKSIDLPREICAEIAQGELPPECRQKTLEKLRHPPAA